MAELFGYRTIKDAIVSLITDNSSDINSGLSRSVQQVITMKPDDIVIPTTKYPTICVWLDSIDEEFNGASKRKKATANFQIHLWTYSIGDLDSSIDQSQLLADNINYVLNSNIGITNLSSSRGYLDTTRTLFNYNTDDSGFIAHGYIDLKVIRYLN